jgi:transcriptional regulator with XRE-family HTH domain
VSATIIPGADNRPAIVPPSRLGRLLRETREQRGETTEQVAARLGEGATPALLADVEGGTFDLTDRDVAVLSDAYGVQTRELVPSRSRLVIDLSQGTVAAAGEHRAFATDDADEVLTRYLSLVYALRGLPPGTPVPLRDLDLAVLGQALRMGAGEVEARLVGLMQDPEQKVGTTTRDLRHRLIVPAAGLLVAVTAVGALVLVTRDGDRAETTPTAPISAEEPALPPVSLIPPAVQEQGGEQTERTEEAEPVTAADAPVSEPEAAPETTLPPVTGEAGEVIVEAPDGTGLIGGGATTLER